MNSNVFSMLPDMDTLLDISDNVWLFLVIIFPGIIAAKTFCLRLNLKQCNAKDIVFEVAAFGICNYFIIYFIERCVSIFFADWYTLFFNNAYQWPLQLLLIFLLLFLIVLFLIALPIGLAFALAYFFEKVIKYGLIINQSRSALDYFFVDEQKKYQLCWVIVRLNDDTYIGGQCKYASGQPNQGHLYLTEIRGVNETETGLFFGCKLESLHGIILRPEDYKYLIIMRRDDDKAK